MAGRIALRAHRVFAAAAIDGQRFRLGLEKVHRRRAVEAERRRLQPRQIVQRMVETDGELKSLRITARQSLQPGDVEVEKFLRKDEIFLQQPKALVGSGGERQHSILGAQATGAQCRWPQFARNAPGRDLHGECICQQPAQQFGPQA
jgi:hypothetical protein